MKYIIAIDGPAASGKSSAAEMVAEALKFERVDSGLLYRAMTYIIYGKFSDFDGEDLEIQQFVKLLKIQQIKKNIFYNGENISIHLRTSFIDSKVGIVAKEPFVREKAHELQYEIINSINNGDRDGVGGLVVDGRDIGTVVFPNAFLKMFITANDITRAMRRFQQTGKNYDVILEDLRMRDQMDINRHHGPLRMAEDAILIENDEMSLEETVNKIITLFNEKVSITRK